MISSRTPRFEILAQQSLHGLVYEIAIAADIFDARTRDQPAFVARVTFAERFVV